ncbi:MAG: hypothetical protein LR008_02140 [Candidatus Pacebacteria bacterium]|nr:hypothetical protein [Candidatus Paceibacterota bacterium]
MQTEKDNSIQLKRLSSDSNYYNNVFKKTEKVVSVTFYILSEIHVTPSIDTHIQSIRDRALKTHELSLATLPLQPHQQSEGLLDFQYGLVALESTLKVAQMAGMIPQDIMMLLSDQIDSVLRLINNHYLNNQGISVEELTETVVTKMSAKAQTKSGGRNASRQKRVSIPAGDISTDAYLVYSQLTDRADRIKTVLEAKPQATVKDISEVVTDVSEKTIQRELNSLIEKGQVVREGERRWSRYSVSK